MKQIDKKTVTDTLGGRFSFANRRKNISPIVGKIFRQSSEKACKVHNNGV